MAYHIWHINVSPWEDVSRTFMTPIQRWHLTSRSMYRVFHMFSCPAYIFLLIWQWLTIFGTCVYHHERMCHVHLWYCFDIELWPQGQIYRFLSCLGVQPLTSVCFVIGIPYLAHGSITMRWCVAYIHAPDVTSTFNLKVIGFFLHGFVFGPLLKVILDRVVKIYFFRSIYIMIDEKLLFNRQMRWTGLVTV